MIEQLMAFWNFFFYPLTVIDSLGTVSSVLFLSVLVLAVFRFLQMVFGWILNF